MVDALIPHMRKESIKMFFKQLCIMFSAKIFHLVTIKPIKIDNLRFYIWKNVSCLFMHQLKTKEMKIFFYFFTSKNQLIISTEFNYNIFLMKLSKIFEFNDS